MAKTWDIAVLVGSLRKDSINLKVARALIELVPQSLKPEIIEIEHLPIYNQDGGQKAVETGERYDQRAKKHGIDADIG